MGALTRRPSRQDLDAVAEYRPQLLRFALLRLRNRERAEDAVQDTLLAALEGLDRFAGNASLGTWLTGILKHKIADCLRRAGADEPADPDELPAHEGIPEAALSQARFVEALARGLEALPRTSREVFLLSEIYGFDTAEIRARLGMSDGHCWVALHRARKRLRECPDILACR